MSIAGRAGSAHEPCAPCHSSGTVSGHGGQKYDERPKVGSLFASFRSNVATESYRFEVARATTAASVRPERGFGQSSRIRFHGQSSTICIPGKAVTAPTTVTSWRDVRLYW